ncbi:MAG: succinylglutamate desuccinylase [Verrucomicrobiales bacterium]|nr:succinylglutamate desuccinylase [Verrucomicrobiales bacterium]
MPIELPPWNFSGPADGPKLLVSGGVHGDEFEPIHAIHRLIREFESGERELAAGSLALVPIVNRAAYIRGHRVAEEDGLDLARTCPGDPEGTTTEQAAHAISEKIRKADLYIDLHTGGTELAVWPLTGYHLAEDAEILETQRRMARAFNLPFIWGTSPKVDGRTLSVSRDAGVPGIYAEYLGSATMSPQGCDAYFEGCLNVMAEFGLIERSQPESRVVHVVEDDRPESGHMQICNPSPITGFFEAAVSLGEQVETNQLLGTVSSLDLQEQHEIRAAESGILLVLRTFPRVREGETCGVVVAV